MIDYYILITDAGAALEAAAHAAGTTVELAEFGVCDGGVTFIPDPAATTFPNEVFRGAISALSVSEDDAATLEAQCVIPGTSGGYVIRGLALYAADGTLYATGNYPDQSKPEPESGYAASLEILAQLAVSDTADITLTVTEGEFLTEEEADSLYLRQDKNLSEIAAAGATAQSEARDNLGLKSAATHDAGDFLPSNYTAPVTSVNGKTGAVNLVASDVKAVPVAGGSMTGELNMDAVPQLTYKISALSSGATGTTNCLRIFRGGSGDTIFHERVAGEQYYIATGNDASQVQLTLDTISGQLTLRGEVAPGDYGNFDARYYTQSAANAKFIQGLQLGAERYVAMGGNNVVKANPGEVLTGIDNGNSGVDGFYAKPAQENVNGTWKTIAG